MEPIDSLTSLAQHVYSLESEAEQLSSGWYEFEPTHPADVKRLSAITESCRKELSELSVRLGDLLEQPATAFTREKLNYAYNLVQELMQAREASADLLNIVQSSDTSGYREYFRALALKEKAARRQAEKLLGTVSVVH